MAAQWRFKSWVRGVERAPQPGSASCRQCSALGWPRPRCLAQQRAPPCDRLSFGGSPAVPGCRSTRSRPPTLMPHTCPRGRGGAPGLRASSQGLGCQAPVTARQNQTDVVPGALRPASSPQLAGQA